MTQTGGLAVRQRRSGVIVCTTAHGTGGVGVAAHVQTVGVPLGERPGVNSRCRRLGALDM